MRIKTIVAALLLVAVTAGSVYAFGLPSFGGGDKSAPAGDPDTFLKKAQKAEKLVNKSVDQLGGIILSKEDKAKLEAKKAEAEKIADPAEKGAALNKITAETTDALQKAAENKKESEARLKKLDNKQKKLATAALFNLMLGAMQAAELVPEGQNLAKSVQSNPMLAAKVGAITDSVKSLSGIVSGTAKLISSLPPLFMSAKIDAPKPTGTSDKSQDTDALN
jgi:hypothetical protein